jgi:hypothetical protein
MAKHEIKQCPRCHSDFECKTGLIDRCQCQSVSLDESHMAYVAEHYDDCLCAACLSALRSEYNVLVFERRLSSSLGARYR